MLVTYMTQRDTLDIHIGSFYKTGACAEKTVRGTDLYYCLIIGSLLPRD